MRAVFVTAITFPPGRLGHNAHVVGNAGVAYPEQVLAASTPKLTVAVRTYAPKTSTMAAASAVAATVGD